MNIQPMMLEMNTASISPNQHVHKANTNHEDSFSSVLSKTQDKSDRQENNSVKSSKDPVETKSNSTEEPTNITKTDPSKSESTKEVKPLEEGDLEKNMEAEKIVIQAIADILQITPDQLEQMLATLQVGIMDLLQMGNLQQLLMAAHDVEEPMDLLLIPEITSEIKTITAMLEEFSASSLVDIPEKTQPQQQLEVNVDENILSLNVNTDKDSQANTKMNKENETKISDENNQTLDVDKASVSKVNRPLENDEVPWENEEQSASNQNSSTNQFLETLSQSIGEAFQMQNNQVGEVNEAILGRHQIIEPQVVLDQIVERIKVSVIEEQAQMNIQLKPEHLGKLSMEVISKQGTMTARFTVENEKVKEAIEQNIQTLKETLESRGLVIEELEVTVGQNQQENEQTSTSSRSNRNISQIIDRMMNEDMEEDVALEHRHESQTNEVDFIA